MEAPSSSQTCKVLDCAVAPVVHIIMENGSKAPKAIRMAPEGAPTPQGLALYVITEEIIVSLPALTHRQRGMIKILGIVARCGCWICWSPDPESNSKPGVGLLSHPWRLLCLCSPSASLGERQTDWSPFWWKRLSREEVWAPVSICTHWFRSGFIFICCELKAFLFLHFFHTFYF